MPEKTSSIEKVIVKFPFPYPELKDIIAYKYKEKFDDQKFEELRGLEREKTAEELEIISLANEKTNELLEKFGLEKFDVPAKNIHVVPQEKRKEKEVACFKVNKQAVVTRAEDLKIIFAHHIIHEMLHFKSGTTLLVKKSEKGVPTLKYRLGLRIYEKRFGGKYFENLNEAITEELVKRLVISLRANPLFQDEMYEMEELVEIFPQLIKEDTIALRLTSPPTMG